MLLRSIESSTVLDELLWLEEIMFEHRCMGLITTKTFGHGGVGCSHLPGVQEFLQCYEYYTVGGVERGQIPVNCLQQLLPFHFQQLSEGAFM